MPDPASDWLTAAAWEPPLLSRAAREPPLHAGQNRKTLDRGVDPMECGHRLFLSAPGHG